MKTIKSLTEAEMAELPKLPNEWKWTRLGEIADNIQYGYTESSTNEPIGPKFLRITDIQNNEVIWKSVPYCKIDDVKKQNYLLKDGDLVFARTGATVGKSYLLKGDFPESVFASYLIRVRLFKEILESFVYNFFQSLTYWKQITEGQVGIGQPNVNGSKLSLLIVPVAPLPEQRAIVSKIEQLFSELDNGISNLKLAQEQLKVYRQAVLKKAFEGELTKNKVAMIQKKIGDFAELITKGASPKWQGFNYVSDDSQLLFITSENVREGFIDLTKKKFLPLGFNEKQKRSILKKGDVLFNLVGASIGRAAIFNQEVLSNINQAVAIIRLTDDLNNSYLTYFLNAEIAKQDYLSKVVDVARANLSLADVNNLTIPYCSLPEQQVIVQEIETRLSVCDKIEQDIKENLEKAEVLRHSILKKAFEGKLLNERELAEVQKADYWEPAEVLLERIKAEKADNGKNEKYESAKIEKVA